MSRRDDKDRGPELVVIFSICLAITTFATVLRVYVRAFLIKNFGLDDWTAVLGWFFFVCCAVCYIVAVSYGAGQHNSLVKPPAHEPIAMLLLWIVEHFYFISVMAVKLSIGLMLLRFLQEKRERMLVFVVLGVYEVCSILIFMLFTFICTPVSYFWTRSAGATDGWCFSTTVLIVGTYLYSVLTCIVDWTFAIIPWFILRSLQLDRRTKLLTSLALSLGALASVATIIRLPFVVALRDRDDFLYASVNGALWTLIETALSIVASAATTFKPLFRKFLSRNSKDSMGLGPSNRWRRYPTKLLSTGQSTEPSNNVRSLDDGTHDDRLRYGTTDATSPSQDLSTSVSSPRISLPMYAAACT